MQCAWRPGPSESRATLHALSKRTRCDPRRRHAADHMRTDFRDHRVSSDDPDIGPCSRGIRRQQSSNRVWNPVDIGTEREEGNEREKDPVIHSGVDARQQFEVEDRRRPQADHRASDDKKRFTALAASRPSLIAQTTSDCPRRQSPAAKTFGFEVTKSRSPLLYSAL